MLNWPVVYTLHCQNQTFTKKIQFQYSQNSILIYFILLHKHYFNVKKQT